VGQSDAAGLVDPSSVSPLKPVKVDWTGFAPASEQLMLSDRLGAANKQKRFMCDVKFELMWNWQSYLTGNAS
jgi:hypothetical protein